MKAFASDNYAGVHPEVLAAIGDANGEHVVAYGDDPVTGRMHEVVREQFGPDAQAFPVFNGTAANILAIRACCRPWEAVLTPASSHLHVDEAGAPERLTGNKLLVVPTQDGRLTPEDVAACRVRIGDQHAVQPRLVSIANATELGTVYDVEATRALADAAHANGMLLHVDGARIANAAASAGVGLGELTTAAGVDVLSLGLTKNGALGAEAVVLLRPELAEGFAWLRKQHAQLASKMRFVSAQVVALLEGDLWRRNAAHANAMAQRLAAAVERIDGVAISRPVHANAVFAVLDPEHADRAREHAPFYTWDEATGEVRWMCAWDTTPEDVDGFAAALQAGTAAAVGAGD